MSDYATIERLKDDLEIANEELNDALLTLEQSEQEKDNAEGGLFLTESIIFTYQKMFKDYIKYGDVCGHKNLFDDAQAELLEYPTETIYP